MLMVLLAGCGGPGVDFENEALTPQCGSQFVEGIDVYAGDGTVNWTQVKSSGRAFAFIKATQGNYNMQSTFGADWTNAKAAGLLRSPYHFFDPSIDGVAQANWFLNELNTQGGLRAGDLPAMLDLECPTSSTQSLAQANCEYSGNSGWAPTATILQRALDWLTTVEAATGKRPILYSYPYWFSDTGVTDARLANYPLFIATYASCASVPAPWTTAVFWQYSGSATVPGVAGSCDVDRFFGTLGDLQRYANGSSAPDGGADSGTRDGASDLSSPLDAAGDQRGGTPPGCHCQMSARAHVPALPLLLTVLAFVALRLRRRVTRSSQSVS